jgi:hypothetical protein
VVAVLLISGNCLAFIFTISNSLSLIDRDSGTGNRASNVYVFGAKEKVDGTILLLLDGVPYVTPAQQKQQQQKCR